MTPMQQRLAHLHDLLRNGSEDREYVNHCLVRAEIARLEEIEEAITDLHIATHIATRLEIHDITLYVADPTYGCPETFDVNDYGTVCGVKGSTIEQVLEQLDDLFAGGR